LIGMIMARQAAIINISCCILFSSLLLLVL
jgi:hypothetical protein